MMQITSTVQATRQRVSLSRHCNELMLPTNQ